MLTVNYEMDIMGIANNSQIIQGAISVKEYQTQQRKLLLDFLKKHHDKPFFVEQIAQSLEGISISSVYRNINLMVNEGLVERFQQKGSRKFLYQYLGDSDCAAHLHLKCDICGNILHMDNSLTVKIARIVKQSSNFQLDSSKTFLFGSCTTCK